MRPFQYLRAENVQSAIQAHRTLEVDRDRPEVIAKSQYVAGGTNLIDLMRLDVMRPEVVTDIAAAAKSPSGRVETGPKGLWLGALVRMAEAADHPAIKQDYPVIAQALALAASPQIRNMASLGGNVLQRTRCTYFRDTSYTACNKRNPGSGCAALDGVNRRHAVLGVSDNCIASYAGDFAQALIALDAVVDIAGPSGSRTLPFAKLHKAPGDSPHIETTLAPGELITAFVIPPMSFGRRSLYLKIRDRESYEFALASAAVALDLENGRVKEARIALGGVSAMPWRARAAEEALRGQEINEGSLQAVANTAFAEAKPRDGNAFKVELGRRTLIRALAQAAALEI
jgi:xanthine dehydrogenase YagS FAD-binding subunit